MKKSFIKNITFLFLFVIWVGCHLDQHNSQLEIYPMLKLVSPNGNSTYSVDSVINIIGEINDRTLIHSLTIEIEQDDNVNNIYFHKTISIDSNSCAFNESWQPDSNFIGAFKNFLLVININRDSNRFVPFYQDFVVVK